MRSHTVETFQDCLNQGYTIRAFCITCGRSVPVDLQALVKAGWGKRTFVKRKWRCRKCGELGSISVWPPAHRV